MKFFRDLYTDLWVWSMRFTPELRGGRAMTWKQIRHLRNSRHAA